MIWFLRCPEKVKAETLVDEDKYHEMYAESLRDPNAFWGAHGQRIDWMRPYTKVKDTLYSKENVSIKWYEDGTLNACVNCVDRHLDARGDDIAIIWEGDEPDQDAKITYRQLYEEVCRFANVLKQQGVGRGDRVTIYMPMIPEAGLCHAGMRAHWCRSLGGVWRVFTRSPRRTHSGLRQLLRHHGG
jgi:acetyl-CoA synthetase